MIHEMNVGVVKMAKKKFYVFRKDTGPIDDETRMREIENLAKNIQKFYPEVDVQVTIFGPHILIPEKVADEWVREMEQQFPCKILDASKVR